MEQLARAIEVRVLWYPVDKTCPSCMTGSRATVSFGTSPFQFLGLWNIRMPSYYIQTNCRLQVMSPLVTVAMSGIVPSSEYGLQYSFQHTGNYIPK